MVVAVLLLLLLLLLAVVMALSVVTVGQQCVLRKVVTAASTWSGCSSMGPWPQRSRTTICVTQPAERNEMNRGSVLEGNVLIGNKACGHVRAAHQPHL